MWYSSFKSFGTVLQMPIDVKGRELKPAPRAMELHFVRNAHSGGREIWMGPGTAPLCIDKHCMKGSTLMSALARAGIDKKKFLEVFLDRGKRYVV